MKAANAINYERGAMLPSDRQSTLPSSDELIDSDDFPVDNEEQQRQNDRGQNS